MSVNFILRKLVEGDSNSLSELLNGNSNEYLQYFHPFSFDQGTIKKILKQSIKDVFYGIEILGINQKKIIGFCMLRGLDEGFPSPMFGVFISEEYKGIGLGKLLLQHSEILCRINGYKELLLKVYPQNYKAKELYESLGFQPVRLDNSTNQVVMSKQIKSNEKK